MKNSDFDYSYESIAVGHFDTPESKEKDIRWLRWLFGMHALWPRGKADKILELGCGMGRCMLMLRNAGYGDLTGIDIDKSQIAAAKKEGLKVFLADAVDFMNENDEKYGVIYAFDVLEHIDKEKQLPLLRKMFDSISDDGFAVFSVPNGIAPLAGYFRYTDFTHTVSYTDKTMSFLLNNAGFHFIAVRPDNTESLEVQRLKLPWARLYRAEFGMKDFILTPNLICVAFKNRERLESYLETVPEIHNDYAEPAEPAKKKLCLARLWKHIKSGKF